MHGTQIGVGAHLYDLKRLYSVELPFVALSVVGLALPAAREVRGPEAVLRPLAALAARSEAVVRESVVPVRGRHMRLALLERVGAGRFVRCKLGLELK